MAHKTAIVTHTGRYQFKRLAFGLKNSSARFQCLLSNVPFDLNFTCILIFIDDILCYSKDFEEHRLHLQAIFNRLRRAGRTLKPSKCKFCQTKVHYLGRLFIPEGIEADPRKVLLRITGRFTSRLSMNGISEASYSVKGFMHRLAG